MTELHDKVHAFADGELPPAEAEEFRAHLADCRQCQRELDDILQLSAAVAPLQRAAAPESPLRAQRAFRPSRDWRRQGVLYTGITLAALALLVIAARIGMQRRGPPDLMASLAERPLEARLSYPGATAHRPYSVLRSAQATGAPVPLHVLGELEDRGDWAGVAAGHLLRGERDQAAEALRKAGAGADVDSDLAVVALSQGALEGALILLDDVLAQNPTHPEALWNRALVLREFGLPLVAARSFDQVAAQNEPGWADEARARAAALRRDVEQGHRAWEEAWQAGKALEATGTPVPAGLAPRARGTLRTYFYDGLWSAQSPQQALSLLPLARELDALYGGDRLERYTRAVAASDFSRRAPLASQVHAMFLHTFDPARLEAFVRQAKATGQSDLLLALPAAGGLPRYLREYTEAARALGDPWFTVNADIEQARAWFDESRLADAEAKLLSTLPVSRRERTDFRTLLIESVLANIYVVEVRLTEAREHALAGMALAREMNEWPYEAQFLRNLGDAARMRNAFALTLAYLQEAALRPPIYCQTERYLHESLASLHEFALRFRDARAELDRVPKCQPPLSLLGLEVLAEVSRTDPRPEDLQRMGEAVAALRASGTLRPGQEAYAKHLVGVALLSRDHDAGVRTLLEAIAQSRALPPEDLVGVKARVYGYSFLALDAGRRGAFAEAVTWLAEREGAKAPDRCAVAVELRDEQQVVASIGPSGQVVGRFDGQRRSPAFDVERLIPPDVQENLRGCDHVQVIAQYPVHGSAGLLPADVAWSYRARRSAPVQGAASPKELVVFGVEPPASLGLPKLGSWEVAPAGGSRVELTGAEATPERVLEALQDATYAEIHAHGLVDLGVSDASLIALSPDADGRYALTAAEVRRQRFKGAPVVVLAACRAAQVAPYMHEPWSLPLAFLDAGARAVIASPADLPDAEAQTFFDAVMARIRNGAPAASAVRDERVRALAQDPSSWTQTVVVFE